MNEGLDVEIQAGGFGIDPFALVVSKGAHFAVVGADKAAIALGNGAPIRVVAVDFQRNPVGWIVRESKGIKSIRDLLSHRDLVLGDKIGTETTAILNVMLSRLNLEDSLEAEGVGFDFAYFFQNENVVYPVYLNEEPIRARAKDIDIAEIDPAAPENGGVRLYGNVIIAHQDLIEKQPQTVQSFVSGLRRGWQFAKENPNEATEILKDKMDYDSDVIGEVIRRSVRFASTSYGIEVPPGHMEVGAWQRTLKVLEEAGVLEEEIKMSDLVWMEAQ